MTMNHEGRTISAARRHLSIDTSSIVPWISRRSRLWFFSSTSSPRIARTSASLFALPVMKFNSLGPIFLATWFRLKRLRSSLVSWNVVVKRTQAWTLSSALAAWILYVCEDSGRSTVVSQSFRAFELYLPAWYQGDLLLCLEFDLFTAFGDGRLHLQASTRHSFIHRS